MNSLSRSSSRRRSRGSRAIISIQSVLLFKFSEVQATFARRVAQRLDAAVIEVAAAIENNVLDALLFRPLRYEFADRLRSIDAGAGLTALTRRLFHRRCRHHGHTVLIIDHLRVDVFRGAEDGQPLAVTGSTA